MATTARTRIMNAPCVSKNPKNWRTLDEQSCAPRVLRRQRHTKVARLRQAAGQKSGNPFALIRALQVEGESQIEESIPILIQANRLLACGSRDPSEHPGAAENDALGGD